MFVPLLQGHEILISMTYFGRVGLVVIALVLAAFFADVRAEGRPAIEQLVSDLTCLTPSISDRGSPDYPTDELNVKAAGKVSVRLSFKSRTLPPKVTVLEKVGTYKFVESVERFVEKYRLPCMTALSGEVIAEQTFIFNPENGGPVQFNEVSDANSTALDERCISGTLRGIFYPGQAAEEGKGGNVLVSYSFSAANEEPQLTVLYNARSERLASAVRGYLKEFRYTCPIPADKPVKLTQTFKFILEGADRVAFKDFSLVEFLQSVKRADLRGAKFDFKLMGCPFDISVRVRRPYAKNVVGEYGVKNPARSEFIGWVSELTMELPESSEPYLIDQSLKVSVPCMAISL